MRLVRASALVAAALLAVACGQEAPAVTEARLALPHAMVSLDPHDHNDSVTGAVLSAVYDSLVEVSPGEPVQPRLADRWVTPDDLTWRFRLRDGAVFHDGSPVTLDDVVASLRRARYDPDSALASYIEPVREIHVVDTGELELEIRTAEPFPLLLPRLAMVAVLPGGTPASPPVGTGPYRWVSGGRDGPVRLERWESYWGPPPPMSAVTIRFVESESELAERLERGELDVVASVSEALGARYALRPGWLRQTIPAVATTILGLPVDRPPLDDPAVREAIDVALDRRQLVADAFPAKTVEPASSVVPPEVFGFTDTDDPPEWSLARARRLVAASGATGTGPVHLDWASNVSETAVASIAWSLARIGLEVEPVQQPYAELYAKIESGTTGMFVFAWNFSLGDPAGFLESMAHSRQPERGLGLLNATGFADPELDRWVEDASREPVSARRLELVRWSLARLAAQRPYLPLYHHSRIALLRRPFRIDAPSASFVRPQEIFAE
jgi:peptide/nickel transport system substrate-binding protein